METNYFEWIENYISGALKGEQLKAFEEQLKIDSILAERVALEKEIIDAIGLSGERALRKQLKTYHQEMQEQDSGRIISLKKSYYLVAASLMLFALIGSWFLRTDNNTQTARIEQQKEHILDFKNISNLPSSKGTLQKTSYQLHDSIKPQKASIYKDLDEKEGIYKLHIFNYDDCKVSEDSLRLFIHPPIKRVAGEIIPINYYTYNGTLLNLFGNLNIKQLSLHIENNQLYLLMGEKKYLITQHNEPNALSRIKE